MFAIAWSQGAYKASWANWRVSLIVGACLLLAGNGGVTIAEKYIDSRPGGADCGDRPDLHRRSRVGHGNGPQAEHRSSGWVWPAVLLGLAFCLGQALRFLQTADDILRSEC